MLENIRLSVGQEYQKKFEAEKAKFESQLRQMKEDHEAAVAEIKARKAIKDTAEQQIKFNEALAKAVAEKDKQLKMQSSSNGGSNGAVDENEHARYVPVRTYVRAERKNPFTHLITDHPDFSGPSRFYSTNFGMIDLKFALFSCFGQP